MSLAISESSYSPHFTSMLRLAVRRWNGIRARNNAAIVSDIQMYHRFSERFGTANPCRSKQIRLVVTHREGSASHRSNKIIDYWHQQSSRNILLCHVWCPAMAVAVSNSICLRKPSMLRIRILARAPRCFISIAILCFWKFQYHDAEENDYPNIEIILHCCFRLVR